MGSSAILQSPWGSSTFEVGRGIRQGAVESPLMFAAIIEWVLQDASNRYQWNTCTSTYPDLPLTQTAYMDDIILWDGNTQELQLRVKQLGDEFALWGLSINLKKCSLYVSPLHQGPNYIEVNGSKLCAQPSINIMGVNFSVGASTHELLQATWQRAKGKFWANKHLLCAKNPLAGRMRLMDRVIGGAALWNIAAFFPDPTTMEALNNLKFSLLCGCSTPEILLRDLGCIPTKISAPSPPNHPHAPRHPMVHPVVTSLLELLWSHSTKPPHSLTNCSQHTLPLPHSRMVGTTTTTFIRPPPYGTLFSEVSSYGPTYEQGCRGSLEGKGYGQGCLARCMQCLDFPTRLTLGKW